MQLIPIALLTLSAVGPQGPVNAAGDTAGPVRTDARIGTGLGAPRGDGPGFEIAFEPRGPVVQPVWGADAPDSPWLGLELSSIARGAHVVATGGAVAPEVLAPEDPAVGPAGVLYPRGAAVELYEPRGAGFEQSFVLAERPTGDGDLVVRLRMTGPLATAPHVQGPGGLTLAPADPAYHGGVHIGAVVGIDANDARVDGELRRDGEHVELVLPAAFVDAASYPLVVDPLIGSTFLIDGGTVDSHARDNAYDANTHTWLSVFTRTFSSGDVRLRAQRLTDSGTASGGTIFLGSTSTSVVDHPRVANVHQVDGFGVVWIDRVDTIFGPLDYLRYQGIQATTGAIGALTLLDSNPGGELHTPDVAGGSLHDPEGSAIVVYRESGVGIKTIRVVTPAAGDPIALPATTVASQPFLASLADPAISRMGTLENQYLLVYRLISLTSSDVRATLLDGLGKVKVPAFSVTSTASLDEIEPEVDGDGRTFVVAWSVPKSAGNVYNDVRASIVRFAPGPVAVVEPSVALDPALFATQRRPLVANNLGKTLIAYSYNLAGSVPRVIGVDSHTLSICEAPFFLGFPIDPEHLALASASSGGQVADDRALLTFSSDNSLAVQTYGQLLDATGPGGAVVDLGGGCGLGGAQSIQGPAAIGNGYLILHLAGADSTATLAILNVALNPPAPFSCGPCVWTPWQFTFVQNAAGGGASHGIAIPCSTTLLGLQLETQWTVPSPSAAPCGLFPGYSLSNRVRLTVGS